MSTVPERFAPFVRDDVSWLTPSEILKTVVMLFFLPIKIFFSLFWYGIYTTYCFIGTYGMKNEDFAKPPTKWRRFWISGVLDIFSWVGFKQTDWFTFSLGFPAIKIYGDNSMVCKETGQKANILTTNHSSYFDIFLLMISAADVPAFVAKAEVQKVPLIGWKSRIWQCLYVDRFAQKSEGVATKIIERSSNYDYPSVVIFPEGTTTNGKYLLPFKTGAFISGNPVKPVAIKYPHQYFSPTWESCKFPYHILRLLLQFKNECEIYFLPVYVPNEEEKKNPDLYAQNVREAIAQVLGAKLSTSTLQDKIDYIKSLRGEFKSD